MDETYRDATSFEDLLKAVPRARKPTQASINKAPTEIISSPPSEEYEDATIVDKPRFLEEANNPALSEEQLKDVTLPTSHLVKLDQHEKLVSGLDVDRSGSRLISVSHDQTAALYDFPGLDCTLAPFRFIRPLKTIPIRGVKFSPNGELILVTGGGAPLILDRHGALNYEYARGDQYLRDMKMTGGHVGTVLAGSWHPTRRGTLITAGQDGTVRWWGVEQKKCEQVLVVRARQAGPHPIVSQAFFTTLADDSIITAVDDGSLRIYDGKGPWVRPALEVTNAHQPNCLVTSLALTENGHLMASRAMDHTVKLWDLRNFKNPLASQMGLQNDYEETGVIFSPDGQLVLTGSSIKPGNGQMGKLHVFETVTGLNPKGCISIAPTSVVSLLWPKSLNQIFLGLGDGIVRAYYDPDTSRNGIMIGVNRPATSQSASSAYVGAVTDAVIINPHALPLFRNNEKLIMSRTSAKKAKFKARLDPKTSQRPELPVEGPGSGGRIGSSVTQSIMKHLIKDTIRDEDPREALLKYAEIAIKEPLFVTPAYQDTQPNPILDPGLLQKEVEEEEKRAQADAALEKLARKLGPPPKR